MQTVLIAVDGSSRASVVVREGIVIARALRARVFLYRVIAIPPEFTPGGELDSLPAHLHEAALRDLAALSSDYPAIVFGLRVEEASQPWRAILQAADEENAVLIVIGSHGYHGWDRLLGTTAGKVANVAHRNVLVVHAEAERIDEG